jgi:hypothetical protein
MNQLANVIGTLSFALSALAYLMTDILKLRMLAIAAGVTGLLYNALLPSGPLWLVLFWLSLFFVINCANLARAIVAQMEVSLSADQKALLAETFPSMHSRDWMQLLAMKEAGC